MAKTIALRGFIKNPSAILLAAPSGAGKTSLFTQLIKFRNDIFDVQFNNIILCYAIHQDIYDSLHKTEGVILHNGIPNQEDLLKWISNGHNLLILDDLSEQLLDKNNIKFVTALFEKYIHHYNLTTILIAHNIFTKNLRHISLNAHYLFLLNHKRDASQINYLGRQIAPTNVTGFIMAYKDAIQSSRSIEKDVIKIPGYALLNVHPHNTDYQMITRIFPFQYPPIIYEYE